MYYYNYYYNHYFSIFLCTYTLIVPSCESIRCGNFPEKNPEYSLLSEVQKDPLIPHPDTVVSINITHRLHSRHESIVTRRDNHASVHLAGSKRRGKGGAKKERGRKTRGETTEAALMARTFHGGTARCISRSCTRLSSPLDVVSYSCCDALDRRGNSQ